MFYTKSIQETMSDLNCTLGGLTSSEAIIRNKQYGLNLLPTAKKSNIFDIFIEQFKSPIIYILLIAAIISFSINEFTDAGFIMAVLLINALIGTFQEYNAGLKADTLKKVLKTYVIVLRDNKHLKILSEDLTIGDIVFFESGIKVPADIRLISTTDLQVNESLLTGESIEITKNANFISSNINIPIGDRQNMLYAGSIVTKGRATGIVTDIGEQTEVGKIATLLSSSKTTKPPLLVRIEQFSINIAKIIGTVVVIIIFVGIYNEIGIKEIFFLTVAIAVSTIPEGLPVAITVALSVASSVMSKRNVIVRKLSAIEALGSCTLIASDKTGTMTQNELTVEYFITPKKVSTAKEHIDKYALLGSLLCNEVKIQSQNDSFTFLGDQVDVALAKYALNIDKSLINLHIQNKAIDKFPYEPVNKFSAMTYNIDNQKLHFIKGSPEVILSKCDISKDTYHEIITQVDAWADKGFRNIALAYKESFEDNIATTKYKYLGFAAIIDPLREGVKDAIKITSQAGIEVVMITGDHPNTAFFIAKELGIAKSKDEVIEAQEISYWYENGAQKEYIAQKRVFARISPQQKQVIVKTFQDLGHFVAVTGDGVNDAPALKYANIGISMGKSGTDVARESSDLILTDDSFSSIVNGIEEGRVAYDNIRKVIHLLISTGFAEIVLILLSILLFVPIPLLPVQLLWLNLVTNGIQDVALGFEKAEPGILKRKARDPKEPIFNKTMISRVIVGGLYMGITAFMVFYTLLQYGYSEDMARNITLLLMVLFENIHVFNSRTENHSIFKIDHSKNKLLWLSVIFAQAIHILSMYNPFMQSILDIQPVSFEIWGILLCIAIVLTVVMEIEKKIRCR